MDKRQAQDNRRLLRSGLAALIFHALVLAALAVLIAVNGGSSDERIGMITLNLETSLPPGPLASIRAERADLPPAPAPSAGPKAAEPKVAASKDAAPKATESKTATAAADKTGTTAGRTATERDDGTIREYAPPKKNEAATKTEAPPSQLDRESLSRLDDALQRAGDGDGSGDGAAGGNGGGGGRSRTSTTWEDRAVRELLSQAAPVIPRWVSEQGLRLKVELNVELNADGLVVVRGVKVSSGYPDVDAAVARAVSRWKYSRGAGTQAVRGTVTYYIELK